MDTRILQPGNPVIHYPVEGRPAAEIDLSDNNRFLLYEVESVRDDKVQLTPADDRPLPSVIKFFNELIDEGTWWTRSAW